MKDSLSTNGWSNWISVSKRMNLILYINIINSNGFWTIKCETEAFRKEKHRRKSSGYRAGQRVLRFDMTY